VSDKGRDSQVAIVLVMPKLLGTYGDSGNATVLRERARRRGLDAVVVEAERGTDIPERGDIYLLGGGEDTNQMAATADLLQAPGFRRAMDRGATTLAVCAGLQLLGNWFLGPDGEQHAGLGVLDLTTTRARVRHVGDVAAEPLVPELHQPLVGFENHQGDTHLAPSAQPFARVPAPRPWQRPRPEGAVSGGVIGTYFHGPVLALNPELADLLLSRVVGPLAPLDDTEIQRAREVRMHVHRGNAKRTASWVRS
jgi:CobQ-like glutamine amidotransferase family enzyme